MSCIKDSRTQKRFVKVNKPLLAEAKPNTLQIPRVYNLILNRVI